jgi:SAM-dependent methyltransferase
MDEVIWHDVECGCYEADLALWDELAEQAEGAILELGCGAGRVTVRLGKREEMVIGLDWNPELVGALWERSGWRSGDAEIGDVRDFDIPVEFDLVLAPMQVIQLLATRRDRIDCLDCVARHLAPGGLAAFAIVEALPPPLSDDGGAPPLPDVRQLEGWIYSSLPLEPVVEDGLVIVRRLRQTVSPDGELKEELNEVELRLLSADALEREAAGVGLRPAGRRAVPATEAHVGSTVVLLERES